MNEPINAAANGGPVRTIRDLRESGLLWLINRVVFHPRGFALGFVADQAGDFIGWQLLGDGTEVWQMGPDADEDALFRAAQSTFAVRASMAIAGLADPKVDPDPQEPSP